jgi:hypothetical protein
MAWTLVGILPHVQDKSNTKSVSIERRVWINCRWLDLNQLTTRGSAVIVGHLLSLVAGSPHRRG